MKRISFWVWTSNISAFVAVMILITIRFFDTYIKIFTPFLIIGCLSIFLYVLSEILKFFIKKSIKDESQKN
ncbi:hypothetical protein OA88_12375 [Flavobacterium sp. JRM]|nr:hypothetical protein OA88_12375 [Flavobacterium sp. JRM]